MGTWGMFELMARNSAKSENDGGKGEMNGDHEHLPHLEMRDTTGAYLGTMVDQA